MNWNLVDYSCKLNKIIGECYSQGWKLQKIITMRYFYYTIFQCFKILNFSQLEVKPQKLESKAKQVQRLQILISQHFAHLNVYSQPPSFMNNLTHSRVNENSLGILCMHSKRQSGWKKAKKWRKIKIEKNSCKYSTVHELLRWLLMHLPFHWNKKQQTHIGNCWMKMRWGWKYPEANLN